MNETPPQTQETKPKILLTKEQCRAVETINAWFEQPIISHHIFKLGGYAGTGKTTIIKTILESLGENKSIVVSAFTGKACNVLQRKSINAQTLHSLMYDASQDKDGWHFTRKLRLEARPDLIIVDEASMLSKDLLTDLLLFKIKVLFVGDPGQLEPVGDNPNLMAEPDFILSKIHRQAESSPIISLASKVRTGVGSCLLPTEQWTNQGLSIRPKNLNPQAILDASQLICAKNATRTAFNTTVRRHLNRPPKSIVVGDKIIVLRNNLSFAVFNGMILFIVDIHKENAEDWDCSCKDEVGITHRLNIWKVPFITVIKKDAYIPRRYVYCDFAYAITCHKSQGSEWDDVIVYDEWMPPQVWDMRRWRYTSITRAAKKLLYLV